MDKRNSNFNEEQKIPSIVVKAVGSGIILAIVVFFISIAVGEMINSGKNEYTYYTYILVAISILTGTLLACTNIIVNQMKLNNLTKK